MNARLVAALEQMEAAQRDTAPPFRITVPEPYLSEIKAMAEEAQNAVSVFGIQIRSSKWMPSNRMFFEYPDGSGAIFKIDEAQP